MANSPRTRTQLGIFLSSTNDPVVRQYRQIARDIIEEHFSSTWYVVDMGGFLPDQEPPLETCKDEVEKCAVYVGLLGPFYGSIIPQGGLSYTEFEYRVASASGRHIAIFHLPLNILQQSDPQFIFDQGRNFERQHHFVARVSSQHTLRDVSDLEDFKTHFFNFMHGLSVKDDPSISRDHPIVDSPKTIHIITGGKGGVGKTLLGLSIVVSYVAGLQAETSNGEVLGIDLNTANPDLFRLLEFSPPTNPQGWRISQTGTLSVAKPIDSFVLPDSAWGFWERIYEIASRKDYRERMVIVDTNLHVANLDGGPIDPFPTVRKILEIANQRILIWIVWTYASIAENNDLLPVMNRFKSEFEG